VLRKRVHMEMCMDHEHTVQENVTGFGCDLSLKGSCAGSLLLHVAVLRDGGT
jgi:hypothetical protein